MAPNTLAPPQVDPTKITSNVHHTTFHRLTQGSSSSLSSSKEEKNSVKGKRWKGDRKEIFYDGYYYDVTDWIAKHPGGDIIQFYAKSMEDATLPIQQFHARNFTKVNGIMKQFRKRPAPQSPPVLDTEMMKKHRVLTEDFLQLYEELEAEGLFKPSLIHTYYRVGEVIFLFFLASYLLFPYAGPSSTLTTIMGVLVFAVFGTRCGYLGHEGGHRSLTGNPVIDDKIQVFSFGWGIGLSGSCWNSQHNKHHSMPQRLGRDEDLGTLPLMAFNEKVLDGVTDGGNFFVRNQAALSLTLDTFIVILVWKCWMHPLYVLKNGKHLELMSMCVHLLYVSLFVGFWPYVFSVWLGSMYLFGNYVLSHSHLPVTEEPLHWVEYAFIHTQDIDSSWWIDWWMGYLNTQIEHHLFPTMPHFRNKLAKKRVIALAAKHNLPYMCHSYSNVVMKCMQNLKEVSEHLREEINLS